MNAGSFISYLGDEGGFDGVYTTFVRMLDAKGRHRRQGTQPARPLGQDTPPCIHLCAVYFHRQPCGLS